MDDLTQLVCGRAQPRVEIGQSTSGFSATPTAKPTTAVRFTAILQGHDF
jgi:hypothetical protein